MLNFKLDRNFEEMVFWNVGPKSVLESRFKLTFNAVLSQR